MREIKFRAFEKTENLLIGVGTFYFTYKSILLDNGEEYCFDEVELMQYTGLNDRNGVEIYEGDIFYDDADNHIGVVTFLNGAFVCESYFDGFEKEELEPSDNRCFLAERLIRDYGNVFEVIGNFYENKELLDER